MTEQKIHLGMQMPSGAGKGKKKKGGGLVLLDP